MCVVCVLFVKNLRLLTKPMSDCLLMLRNERWKRVRSILTPAFSASKMKEVRSKCVGTVQLKIRCSGFLQSNQCSWMSMFFYWLECSNYFVWPLIDDICQVMSSNISSQSISLHFLLYSPSDGSAHQHSHWCLNEELRCFCWIWGGLQHPQVNGQRLEVRGIMGSFFLYFPPFIFCSCFFDRCFGCFTMDVIASVAFETQVDSQNNTDDPFVRHAQLFFSFSLFRPIALLFGQSKYFFLLMDLCRLLNLRWNAKRYTYSCDF